MATVMADVGVQSSLDVNSVPVIPNAGLASQPHVWTWVWFILAILIILGFHVRVFGKAVPPGASFP